MPQSSTLQDVADRARVHRSTVALALRDHPRISAATRARIQSIAQKLGYRINPLVAALMQSRRTKRSAQSATLAFVTNYPTRYGWRPEHHARPDFFPGAVERARDFGFRLDHLWLGEPGMNPKRFCDILVTRGVHGLLLARLPPGKYEFDLLWERFSVVALGMTLLRPRLHHVTENHFDTALQAMQQCRNRGYRRIGFVFSDADDSPSVGERWLGAYHVQQALFPAKDRLPVCPGSPASPAQFHTWFKRYRPDALLVNHAPAVHAWLGLIGRTIPRDVGLVELEDHPDQGSSGVYYDPAKIGALSIEMLVGLVQRNEKGIPADPHEVLLTGKWREGRTLPSRRA